MSTPVRQTTFMSFRDSNENTVAILAIGDSPVVGAVARVTLGSPSEMIDLELSPNDLDVVIAALQERREKVADDAH